MSTATNKPNLILTKQLEEILCVMLPDPYVAKQNNRAVKFLKDLVERLNDVEDRLSVLEP